MGAFCIKLVSYSKKISTPNRCADFFGGGYPLSIPQECEARALPSFSKKTREVPVILSPQMWEMLESTTTEQSQEKYTRMVVDLPFGYGHGT